MFIRIWACKHFNSWYRERKLFSKRNYNTIYRSGVRTAIGKHMCLAPTKLISCERSMKNVEPLMLPGSNYDSYPKVHLKSFLFWILSEKEWKVEETRGEEDLSPATWGNGGPCSHMQRWMPDNWTSWQGSKAKCNPLQLPCLQRTRSTRSTLCWLQEPSPRWLHSLQEDVATAWAPLSVMRAG